MTVLFFFLFLCISILWPYYWAIVRPCLLDQVDLDYARLRARVDWAIIDREPEARTRAAFELARNLEFSPATRSLSISNIIYSVWTHRATFRAYSEKERRIFHAVSPWIREMHAEDMRLTMKAALVNSPVWWPFLASFLLGTYFSHKMARGWELLVSAASYLRSEESADHQASEELILV